MPGISIQPTGPLGGKIIPPGDKSISHRSIMISSISSGETSIKNFLFSDDCLRTIQAFRQMGVDIGYEPKGSKEPSVVKVRGKGLRALRAPGKELYMGNSGTSMRLMLGILAGQRFCATLTADASLSGRPMKRVLEPLRMMGAQIEAKKAAGIEDGEYYPPITIKGGGLKGIKYKLPVASAQVKSAILLAGLYAKGKTVVEEPYKSRDHTERMLKDFGAPIEVKGRGVISIEAAPYLYPPSELFIPGDISSSAFFIVAAILIKGSELRISSVGLNPTRRGFIDILKRMGSDIQIIKSKTAPLFEPSGDIIVKSSDLRGITIRKDQIPRTIDELPVLMVAASKATGLTVIRGAEELRVKETDRIKSMSQNLKKMGADIEVKQNAIFIRGVRTLKGARVSSYGDHRTAMSMVTAALAARGSTFIGDAECIATSFPKFMKMLERLSY